MLTKERNEFAAIVFICAESLNSSHSDTEQDEILNDLIKKQTLTQQTNMETTMKS